MSFWKDFFEAAFPLILDALQSLADSQVDGATLNKDQRQTVYSGYVILSVWGTQLVESSKNNYDDQTLETLKEFAADTLNEAEIPVPVFPEF